MRRPRDPADQARAAARRAYGHAREAGGLATAIADRLWSETLMAVDGKRTETRTEMFSRTATLFALLADRQTWPR
jgi:hypothetical protein